MKHIYSQIEIKLRSLDDALNRDKITSEIKNLVLDELSQETISIKQACTIIETTAFLIREQNRSYRLNTDSFYSRIPDFFKDETYKEVILHWYRLCEHVDNTIDEAQRILKEDYGEDIVEDTLSYLLGSKKITLIIDRYDDIFISKTNQCQT